MALNPWPVASGTYRPIQEPRLEKALVCSGLDVPTDAKLSPLSLSEKFSTEVMMFCMEDGLFISFFANSEDAMVFCYNTGSSLAR
jgi:hypothetical protein